MENHLQNILKDFDFEDHKNPHIGKTLHKLSQCRTSAMGYHLYRCNNPECGHLHYQYHACRNRHCPQCNWNKQQEWMEARTNELLPVKYFHVVFTLPHELNSLVMGNRTVLFKQLFDSASYTLLQLSNNPKWLGAMPSITAVLHTWGQQLSFHPHLHCIVSGGGVDKDMNWVDLKKKSHQGYLFPYKVMESMFKKHFLKNVGRLIAENKVKIEESFSWSTLSNDLEQKKWVVYAKSPMGSVSQVVEYLARYSHKVAISNHRILEVRPQEVLFNYKDYNDHKKTKQMVLSKAEFVRRFEQHILPKGFVKMRHYGILGNFKRKQRINQILQKMGLPEHPPTTQVPFFIRLIEKFGYDIRQCQHCKKGHFELMEKVYPRNRGSPFGTTWGALNPQFS